MESPQPPSDAPARPAGRDLTSGSIPRHLVAFSLPMLAGGALQTAYSFINAIWVGQFLGKSALAAVTVSFPVFFVLTAIGAGMTMATSILIAQYYGARRHDELRKVVDSSNVMIGGLSLALFGFGEVLTPHILRAMGTPPEVLPLAISYMRIFLVSLPFGFQLFLFRSMLQGIGDSKTPLYFQALSVVVNTVLDPVLMFGWLGLPKLGLNGTAWATLAAHASAVLPLWYYLHRARSPVAPAWRNTRFDWSTAAITFRIGLPASVQQSLVSIGMVFVTGIVNGFGENATAAFGAAIRVDQLAFLPAMTFSLAVSTLAGQNIGAGLYRRVKEVFWWGNAFSGGITLACSALVVAFPDMLLRIFTNDAQVIETGVHYLRIVGPCYVFFAVMFVANGIINGAGHTLVTTVISLISLWIVRVPIAVWLSGRMHSVDGVWYAMAISFFVSMACSLGYYISGAWRTAIARTRPDVPEALLADEFSEV